MARVEHDDAADIETAQVQIDEWMLYLDIHKKGPVAGWLDIGDLDAIPAGALFKPCVNIQMTRNLPQRDDFGSRAVGTGQVDINQLI